MKSWWARLCHDNVTDASYASGCDCHQPRHTSSAHHEHSISIAPGRQPPEWLHHPAALIFQDAFCLLYYGLVSNTNFLYQRRLLEFALPNDRVGQLGRLRYEYRHNNTFAFDAYGLRPQTQETIEKPPHLEYPRR